MHSEIHKYIYYMSFGRIARTVEGFCLRTYTQEV